MALQKRTPLSGGAHGYQSKGKRSLVAALAGLRMCYIHPYSMARFALSQPLLKLSPAFTKPCLAGRLAFKCCVFPVHHAPSIRANIQEFVKFKSFIDLFTSCLNKLGF
ncbi:hypothetical protein KUF54_06060 [Comamonas sp. Y33R10-2]|uniref:hypothetical protein n=1 Tax=Comamonas sp. Y33R10-2 TaxID=2853257 RepID=UPI001C5CA1D4|nr:hypothetical protein [Comamonas sp. Y33R10-2]QXZ10768.1 hypothetical protein KUF54_06060 [Comamonas sp. Y33R10-2]